jgi:hypothetical protein
MLFLLRANVDVIVERSRAGCSGLEQIHGNQLAALLNEADKLDGQLILATLRDKLPPMPIKFVEDNTVLELAQDDKLFRI